MNTNEILENEVASDIMCKFSIDMTLGLGWVGQSDISQPKLN